MPRAEFSRKVRAAAFLRCGGLCGGCGARLKAGEAEYDHELPDALCGPATLENCKVLCRQCHRSKTASDVARIRKADRQRDRHTGAMPPARVRIRSAGFAKKPKRKIEQLPIPPRRLLWGVGTSDGD